MRILHVVRSDGFSGVERHIVDLARAQVYAGERVVVVGGDAASVSAALAGLSVHHRPAATLSETWTQVQRLATGADLVHAHMTAAEAAACAAPSAWRRPVVSTRHFAERRGAGALRPARWLSPLLNRGLAAQIAVSEYAAARVDGPTTVVHAGVPSQPDVAFHERGPVILVAQRLEREKHTDIALRAFASADLRQAGWRLAVAGDGQERPRLEAEARRLGVAGETTFLGHVRDVGPLMRSAGVLLATRPDEAYGLSVLEAMAHGLPVVAAGAGGHVETVGSVPGALLFPPGDADEAGRMLLRLAEDRERREAYGATLREAQRERFTMDAQVRATDAVYRSVL